MITVFLWSLCGNKTIHMSLVQHLIQAAYISRVSDREKERERERERDRKREREREQV